MRRDYIFLAIVFLAALMAQSATALLSVTSIVGSGGINGYIMQNDTILLNITSSSNVTITNKPSAVCICAPNSTSCLCQFTDNVNSSLAVYVVRNLQGESANAIARLDNSIGSIDFSVKSYGGNAYLNYTITDSASSGCSGIRGIEVYVSGESRNSVTLNASPANCTIHGFVPITAESGTKEIYLKVTDGVGNIKESEHRNYTIDISAPKISDVIIKSGQKELKAVAQNVDMAVDIYFDIEESSLEAINADISGITTNPTVKPSYKNIAISPSSCTANSTQDATIYHCVIKGKTLRTRSGDINITISATDSYGNSASESFSIPMTIDNDRPKATLTTQSCDSTGKCYVKNGLNRINVILSKNNFDSKSIIVNVGSTIMGMTNCTEGQCFGFVAIRCNSGQQVAAAISPQSRDDAGNPLNASRATFYCDNTYPSVQNITITGDYYQNLVVSGQMATITALVADADTSELYANAYFDKMKNSTEAGKCTPTPAGLFECKWTVSPINAGQYVANIKFNFSDVVNNTVTTAVDKIVLGFKANNVTPTMLENPNSVEVTPRSVNRVTLGLAATNSIPFYVYAQYKITTKAKNVTIVNQDISINDCIYIADDGDTRPGSQAFSGVSIADPKANVGQTNRIDLVFIGSDAEIYNRLHDSFRLDCNISVYVVEKNNVYKKPQIVTISIPIKLRNSVLNEPGQQFVDKIKEREDDVKGKDAQLLSTLNRYMGTLQGICDLKQDADYANIAGVIMEAAGAAINIFASPAGDGVQNEGFTIGSAARGILDGTYNPGTEAGIVPAEKLWGIAKQACDFMSCQLDWNKDLTWELDSSIKDEVTSVTDEVPWIGKELGDSLQASDLKNSIGMSVAKLCLPSIIYNLNTRRQIKCEEIQCLKVYSATGLDIGQCENVYSSKMCAMVVGEVFEAPFVRIGKNLFSNMADVIRQSYGRAFIEILKVFRSDSSCQDPKSVPGLYLCRIPYALQGYLSDSKRTSLARQFHYDTTIDYCSIAECTGPQCYKTSNDILGIPMSRLTPSAELEKRAEKERLARQNYGMSADALQHVMGTLYAGTAKQRYEEYLTVNALIDSYNKRNPQKPLPRIYATVDNDAATYDGIKNTEAKNMQVSDEYLQSVNRDIEALSQEEIGGLGANVNSEKYKTDMAWLTKERDAAQASYDAAKARYDDADAHYLAAISPKREDLKNFLGQLSTSKVKVSELNPQYKSDNERNSVEAKHRLDILYTAFKPPQSPEDIDTNAVLEDTKDYFDRKSSALTTYLQSPGERDGDKAISILQANQKVEYDSIAGKYYITQTTTEGSKTQDKRITQVVTRELKDGTVEVKFVSSGGEESDKATAAIQKSFDNVVSIREEVSKKADWEYKKERANQQLDLWMRILMDKLGFRKFLTSEYWDEKIGWKGPTYLAAAVDPENWKKNFCNPDNGIAYNALGGDDAQGAVYQCTGSLSTGCNLVLNYAAEYVKYNATHYLYTVTDVMGPTTKDVYYNVVLRGNTGSVQGFRSWALMKEYTTVHGSRAFLSTKLYTSMCMIFKDDFPPSRISSKKEFCRPIKENVFNTGPVPKSDELDRSNIHAGGPATDSGGYFYE